MYRIKTLVELFDRVQVENVIAGLRFKPEKIIFIGFKDIMTQQKMKAINDFFKNREENIAVEYRKVHDNNLEGIVGTLNNILDENEDCYFDLTGGMELVLAAMGIVSAQRDVSMFRLDVNTGKVIKLKNCRTLEKTEKSHLSLSEGVQLNGCLIIHIEKDDYTWIMTEDFKWDLEMLWKISTEDCRSWNGQSRVFENLEKFGEIDDRLTVRANPEQMKNLKQEVYINNRIIRQLVNNGLILDYSRDGDNITFRYKNQQVHRCIVKAGNVLELYMYMLFREINEESPGYYDDMDISVYVDWDGIIHDENDAVKDTKNEVDIMLMRNLVPLFVSCKNGEVHKEDLYELSVVAQKFGGRYGKKFLLATYIGVDENSVAYIKSRAKDMGITVIDGLDTMTKPEIKQLLKKKIM